MLYLEKSNNDFISHCACERARIAYPGQLDCPWCGCGWLFSCTDCRKAFTYARCIEIDATWEEVARHDITRYRSDGECDEEDMGLWIADMQHLLEDLVLGEEYVWFDGAMVPTSASGIDYEGWYATHELDFIPQIAATTDERVKEELLLNSTYWQERRIDEDAED